MPVNKHPNIRSSAACYASSSLAVKLARETGARLHVLHLSTARELNLLEAGPVSGKKITGEACVAHLLFSQTDYRTLGTLIKCNPAVKTKADRDALRRAVNDDVIDVIATDHAPHLITEKKGGALKAVSGMPMVQFSLVSMLQLVNEGIFTIEKVVEKMCHAPPCSMASANAASSAKAGRPTSCWCAPTPLDAGEEPHPKQVRLESAGGTHLRLARGAHLRQRTYRLRRPRSRRKLSGRGTALRPLSSYSHPADATLLTRLHSQTKKQSEGSQEADTSLSALTLLRNSEGVTPKCFLTYWAKTKRWKIRNRPQSP